MYEKELKIAIQAVKKAEKTFRRYHGTKTKVEMKEGNYRNLVSFADKKIEREIMAFLLKRFPDYGFIGEEHGKTNDQAEFVWALDPIDGTTNYLQGLSDCALSLALLKKGYPVVGVVYAPMLKRLYTASLNSKARLNNKKIHSSKTKKLKNAFGSLGWGRDVKFAAKILPKLIPQSRKLRVPGSAAMALCYVAEGSYDFFLCRHLSIWDYAAGQIILKEAGAKFFISKKSDMHIATNKSLFKHIIAFAKQYG